jgi:RNAse (barnase) inhibitor barstar
MNPDHMQLLALTKAAIAARDNRHLWQKNTLAAAEEHGAACDALWEELEKQVSERDGSVPVLDHPRVTQRKMLARLRTEIVMAAQTAMIDALDELARGPLLDDEG